MNKKFSAWLVIFALIFTTSSVSFAQPKRGATTTSVKQNANNQLAALLPASDGVVNVDLKRLMDTSMPQILSANPDMLNKINAKIAEVQTGIDIRQFEQLAVGISFKQVSAKQIDYAPLALLRGTVNTETVLATAKIAAKDKYREEKIGDKTVYVFSVQEIVKDKKPAVSNSKLGKTVDGVINRLKNDIAVTAYDNNTLVIGTLGRVREMLTAKTHISAEVLTFLNKNPNAVLSFGANTPIGLRQFINIEEDEIGNVLTGVRSLYGAIDTADNNVTVAVTAKSANLQKAKNLEEMASGLQMIGQSFLGSAKGGDKEVYSRMIKNAKITRTLTEVSLDLQVMQTDIDILLRKK